jgi:Putative porin
MKRCITPRLSLLLVFFLFGFIPARAQQMIKPAADSPETNVSERVRLLESELERQNTKLDQLQKTLTEQQATIQALLEKLNVQPSTTVATVKEPEPPASPAPVETPPQTVEERLAKVEAQVKDQTLKVGPVRVSGDFRLRFDGTFRSATDPGEPPLPHVQNARMRYRFRLNLDSELYPNLKFHAQLATGAINNPITLDQDFTSMTVRHPFFLSEAWIDYKPVKSVQLQAGRVREVFEDTNVRFLFDDDIRFNGFNEKYVATFKPVAYLSSLEFRAGQYIFSNPNVAVITPGSPLDRAGQIVGTAGRSANLFHQGVLANQSFNERWNSQFGADIQIYRNPNQIQLASTQDGLVLLVQPGIGLALSGPLPGTGNATTTPGGAIYTAPGFQVARFLYRLNYLGFTRHKHVFPIRFDLQLGRNVATGLNERDAMLAALQLGDTEGNKTEAGDISFLYVFGIKGANSMISQVTDDDLGTGSGVNIRTHHFRFEYKISKKVRFQSLFFFQHSLRRSGQFPNFFVPLGDFAPTTYRTQQQIVFAF